MITDVLHINCLILQKVYSVLLEQSHSHVCYIFISYSAWLSGCEWLSAWNNCNPGYSAALATAPWSCTVLQNSEISGSSHQGQKRQRLQVLCHLHATWREVRNAASGEAHCLQVNCWLGAISALPGKGQGMGIKACGTSVRQRNRENQDAAVAAQDQEGGQPGPTSHPRVSLCWWPLQMWKVRQLNSWLKSGKNSIIKSRLT